MQNSSFCYIEMLMTVLTQIRIVGMDNCIKNEYELDFVYLRFSPLLALEFKSLFILCIMEAGVNNSPC